MQLAIASDHNPDIIEKDDVICAGFTAYQLRFLFRATYREHGVIDAQSISYTLHISAADGEKLLNGLLDDAYIEQYTNDRPGNYRDYQLTPKCSRLLNAKFVQPISRQRANVIVEDLVARIKEAHEDSSELFSIAYACVFGEYMTSSTTLSDVEVAVALTYGSAYIKAVSLFDLYARYAEEHGHTKYKGTLMDYPTKKLVERLRNNVKSLSMRSFDNRIFVESLNAGKAQLIYKHPTLPALEDLNQSDFAMLTRPSGDPFLHRLSYTPVLHGGSDNSARGSVSPKSLAAQQVCSLSTVPSSTLV